ncbi:MAG: hypothetical protein KJP00_05505 [Bacteroidia bacterium]|nr:hypothetical protein [Bacteroidia bacterium]
MNKKGKKTRRNAIPVFRQIIENLDTKALESLLETGLKEEEFQLIDGIRKNAFKSDKGACYDIYGVEKCSSYNQLKASTRVKLIRKLISQVPPQSATFNFGNIYKRVNAEYSAFNILHRSSQGTSAAYLGELIVNSAIKYDFGEFICPISSYLIEYFNIYNPNVKKSNFYKKILEEYSNTIALERKARIMYSELMNLFILQFAPGMKAHEQATHQLSQLEPHLYKIPSTRFHLYTFLIKTFKCYAIKDFPAMNQAAQQGYRYFAELEFRRPLIENTFLRKSVEANLVLGNFQYCEDQLQMILSNAKMGKSNWYNTLEILITLNLHQQAYPKAVKSFNLGKKNRNFNELISTIKTRWGLLEAYINFLQLAGVAPESPTMSRFRINRFINDTPQYEEDKKGRNIQLIIAQLLFYIIDKNWDKMEEKIEALQKYGTRYLRKNELFRSQVFIKMLLEIPRRLYHPQAILRHTSRYRKRLEEMAPNIDLNGSTLDHTIRASLGVDH